MQKFILPDTLPKLKQLSPYKNWLLGILITVLGAAIRIYHYDVLPADNWTADEYAFAWSGMSLIQNHIPTGWSWLTPTDDFPTVVWEAKDLRYRLVTPWFDHPPLFSLLVGLAAILSGATHFFDCSLSVIRMPSVILGILSIGLFYLVGLRLFGTSVAVISSLIFATNPNTVFLSRLAISENLILVLSLVVILCLLEYQKSQKLSYFYSAAIVAGLATLVKVTGIFLAIFLIVWFIYQKEWRKTIIVLLITLLFFSLYYLYGFIYDFSFFQKIIKEQSNRFVDFGILKYLILPSVFFEDGWLIFSWLTLLPLLKSSLDSFKVKMIVLPILIYSLLLVSSGAQSHFFAWYMIPFYPFLFLALGVFLDDFRREPSFLKAGWIFVFLGVWSIHMNITQWIFSSPHGKSYFMIGTAVILLIFLLDEISKRKTKKLTNATCLLAFIALIVANISVVLNYRV